MGLRALAVDRVALTFCCSGGSGRPSARRSRPMRTASSRSTITVGCAADGVWTAGDCTYFSVKSGGFAAEQADVAAAAGASVQERPFDRVLRADLARILRLRLTNKACR